MTYERGVLPKVPFLRADLLQGIIDSERPELSHSYRVSGMRRALSSGRWAASILWVNNTVSPLIELASSDMDRASSIARRWADTTVPASYSDGVSVRWYDGVRERSTSSPFDAADWLRFITGCGLSGELDAHDNEVEAGVYLGLDRNRASALATRRTVMAPRMPMLALASLHLDVPPDRLPGLVELFDIYTSCLYRGSAGRSAYTSLSRDAVEFTNRLCAESGGRVDDVPLWLVFSCIADTTSVELGALMSSCGDPVRAAHLWLSGFSFDSIAVMLSHGLDADMGFTLFTPRAGMGMFDTAVQPVVEFSLEGLFP